MNLCTLKFSVLSLNVGFMLELVCAARFISCLLLFPGLLEQLNDMNSKLEEIQKSLDMYLETKRQIFPRFYFLSNDDLLEILGQSKNPEAVQPHLKKCFDNIKTLDMAKVRLPLCFSLCYDNTFTSYHCYPTVIGCTV